MSENSQAQTDFFKAAASSHGGAGGAGHHRRLRRGGAQAGGRRIWRTTPPAVTPGRQEMDEEDFDPAWLLGCCRAEAASIAGASVPMPRRARRAGLTRWLGLSRTMPATAPPAWASLSSPTPRRGTGAAGRQRSPGWRWRTGGRRWW